MGASGIRGEALLDGGQRYGGGRPGLAARLFAPGMRRLLDRIDRGLIAGAIHATLPDGTRRKLGGRAPGFECEVTLHSWRALLRLATGGSVGWYQAWEAGEWSSPDPVPLFALFMANAVQLGNSARAKGPWRLVAKALHAMKRNTREGAERNIHEHYDLGNDFYAAWLDPTLTYSSALETGADGLDAAQRRKWSALAERIGDAHSVLEIGCGWGGLAGHLAAQGRQVDAISISSRQLEWARAHHKQARFVHQDYRDVSGQYDAIVSVEMVEALGREYWSTFLDVVGRSLKPGGRAALQFITIHEDIFEQYARSADFIQAYIFPGGMLLRESEFRALAEQRGLAWTDQSSFGQDYAHTLKAWRDNFEAAIAKDRLPTGFDERFRNLWRYYLMYCEGGFRGGGIDVHQVTLVKPA